MDEPIFVDSVDEVKTKEIYIYDTTKDLNLVDTEKKLIDCSQSDCLTLDLSQHQDESIFKEISSSQVLITDLSQSQPISVDLSQSQEKNFLLDSSQSIIFSLNASQSQDQTNQQEQKNNSKIPLSSLPLVLPNDSKKRTTILMQLEDKKLDFSGDIGAIGRINVNKKHNLVLDLKGHQYTGEILPSNSFLVVSMGSTEAKVESIVSDFCQIYKNKDMFEGLDGIVTSGIMDKDLIKTSNEKRNKMGVDESNTEKQVEIVKQKKKRTASNKLLTELPSTKKKKNLT